MLLQTTTFLKSVLTIAAALLLSTVPARANYAAKAEDTMKFIQTNLYDAKAKLYRPAVPMKEKELPYDFMWGNGVMFSALVGATKQNPEKYKPVLYAFADGLKKYWDEQAPVPGFRCLFRLARWRR